VLCLCHTDVAAGERSAADFVRLCRDITSRDGNEAVGRLGSGEALAAVVMQRSVARWLGANYHLWRESSRFTLPGGSSGGGKAASDSPACKSPLWSLPLVAEKDPMMVPMEWSLTRGNRPERREK
jgi:hypothetical protein